MTFTNISFIIALLLFQCGCVKDYDKPDGGSEPTENPDSTQYPGVPKSEIYEVTVIRGDTMESLVVFQSTCPEYKPGIKDMEEKDQYPLNIFAGRSISWCHFSFSGSVTVEIRVINPIKVPVTGNVRILPTRYMISPSVQGDVIRFEMTKPGQCSVEIGTHGYKNGLMVFADPPETEIPDQTSPQYTVLDKATALEIAAVPGSCSGIYFKPGVHHMGVYHVPAHIKNIYFEKGSWVYGALIMDGNSDVRIFGRGVLSSAKLNYRESHCIEAIHQSNHIQIEGIVVADPRHFAIRLIGTHNTVNWTKVIGGWVYNCDGIAAYADSQVSNCFIWANDDAIKVYRDNITWTDCVVWQLNNGGIIQMSWGGSVASHVRLSRIDVLRAEWNKPGFNRALLSCIGNRYQTPGKKGLQEDWLIEDVVTENPVPVIFGVIPDGYSANHIHGLTLKNWNVSMLMNSGFENRIIGNDPEHPIDGLVFKDFTFNGVKLNPLNWLEITGMTQKNLELPDFQ